jgi:hypothetical protein
LGYLDTNIKFWNKQAVAAFEAFKSDKEVESFDYDDVCFFSDDWYLAVIKPRDKFTENIISEMLSQGFYMSRGINRNNIIYIRNNINRETFYISRLRHY